MSRPSLGAPPIMHLRSLGVFEALRSTDLDELGAEAQEVVIPGGQRLIRRGERAEAIHVVLDGLVEIGPDVVVGRGGVVGLLEVLAAVPAPVGAVAATDVIALRIEADALRRACESAFPVLDALLAHVADRVLDERHPLLRSIVGRGARPMPADRPLGRVGRIVALHRSPVFPSSSMDALAELAALVEERRLEPGDPLWQAGQPPFGFYLIASGDVHLGGGPWRAGDHLGSGSVPGLMATLSGRPYEYEATASEPSVLLYVRAEPFMDVLEDHFEMAFEMLGRFARNLLDAGSAADVGSSVPEDGGPDRAAW